MFSHRRALHVVIAVTLIALAVGPVAAKSFGDWSAPQSLESLPGSSSQVNTEFLDGCPMRPQASPRWWGRAMVHEVGKRAVMAVDPCISVDPFFHRDSRADPDLALDVKLVHQPFCARQTDPKPLVGGVSILHGLLDIQNARSLIQRGDLDAPAPRHRDALDDDFTPLGVIHDIARDLRDGRRNHRGITARET